MVSKPNKVYGHQEKLVLTFDHQLGTTEIVTIDPNSMTADFRVIKKPELSKTDPYHQSSNSFLFENRFFQINVNADEMIATVLNYSDEEVVQKFHALKEGEISFKNTPIMQEGGSTIYAKEERELSKTKQFLRKVAELDAGISAYKTREGVQVTMGGLQQYTATTGGFSPMGGAPGISTPYGTVPGASPNPTYHSYGTYTMTKSVHFKSLLNPIDFSFQSGEIPQNGFDKIQAFKKKNDSNTVAETIFKTGDVYVLGYYEKKGKKYLMYKFVDK